jgi:DNA adenine methylase
MHNFKHGETVRVINRDGAHRYRMRKKQLSLLPGTVTMRDEHLIQITYDDGGTEYHTPDNLESDEVKSPLKWHGGKFYLASRIIQLIPKGITQYIEPYGGSLAVLLERDCSNCAEIVNDLNNDLMRFWIVLQNDQSFKEFMRTVNAIPFSEMEFAKAYARRETNGLNKPYHEIDRAVDFFVCCRQSRAGCFKDFATITRSRIRSGMNEQVSAWLSSIERLPEVHARLQRVLILNRHAVDVIHQQDCPDAFFYLDPPYHSSTRASNGQYAHEMSDNEHRELLIALGNIQGKFILSGYRCEDYDKFSDICNWYRMDIDMPNNAAGGDVKRIMTESLWMNYKPC